jgi:small-conductance mechanosensitive channel
MERSEDIDAIVEQLRGDNLPKQEVKRPEIENLNDDNVSEYVYKKTAELIETGLESFNVLKDSVVAGQDPKEIAALAQLMGAVTKAIDNLNKINLQAKQHKNNLEVAKVEANGQKQPLLPTTQNIMIATRDEVMDKLFPKGKKDKLDLIEGEFTKE